MTAGIYGYGIWGYHASVGDVDFTMSDGSITTGGGSAPGILGYHAGTGDISVTMSDGGITTEGGTGYGLWGYHLGTGDLGLTQSGGSITTAGTGAHGIFGHGARSGVAQVHLTMLDGDIETNGAAAHGLYGHHSGSGDLSLYVAGSDLVTTGVASRGLLGLFNGTADSEDHRVDLTLVNSAVNVSGDQSVAVDLRHHGQAGKIAATIRNSTITASGAGAKALRFDSSSNRPVALTVGRGTTRILGDIEFTGGDDQWLFDTSGGDLNFDLDGSVTQLERLRKIGAGRARIGSLRSAGSLMSLEAGDLHLTGHLDLGALGALTIHDASRLIFGSDSAGYGRITAQRVHFDDGGWQRVYVADGSAARLQDQDVLLQQGQFAGAAAVSPLLYDESGMEVGWVTEDGLVHFNESMEPEEPPMSGPDGADSGSGSGSADSGSDSMGEDAEAGRGRAAARSGGGSGSGMGAAGVGLMLGGAMLLLDLFEEDEEETGASLGDGRVQYAASRTGDRRTWARTWHGHRTRLAGGEQLRLHGAGSGLDARWGARTRLQLSVLPSVQLSDAAGQAALSGQLITAGGQWRGEQLYAGLHFAHARYEGADLFSDPLTGAAHGSDWRAMRHSHLEARGGVKTVRDGWKLDAQTAVFGGALTQRGHAFGTPALLLDVPRLEQRYAGWKMGLGLQAAAWRPALGLPWRPALKWSSMRVYDGAAKSAAVQYRDRAGVLSFHLPAHSQGIARTVHSLDVGARVRLPQDGRGMLAWRHMQVDGHSHNGVWAGVQWHF